MECSRMVCTAFALLGLIFAAAPVGEAQQVYYVGGNNESNPNWFPQQNAHFYQTWADTLTLYPNDSLVFYFNSTIHDVTGLLTSSDLSNCFIENSNYYSTGNNGRLNLHLITGDKRYYFTSKGTTITNTSADCHQGMHFYVTVVDVPGNSSAPAPPPPVQDALPPPPSSSGNPAPPPVQPDALPPAPSSSGNPAPPPPPDGQSAAATPSPNSDQEQKGKTTFPVAAVAVPIVILSIVVLALVGLLYCRRRYGSKPRGRYQERHVVTSGRFGNSSTSGQASAAIDGILKGNASRHGAGTIFTYAELERATTGFVADNVVGSGGFGTVYKGILDDGKTVAIKKAKPASDVESFVNEVAILSQVNNRNLVKLLGCCVEVESPLLVYEFIPNGTLQDHLSIAQKGFNTRLDWNTRFRIALQTAEALKYLHVQATPPIFHRDVKSANILLDDNFNGKVADFGLSKLVDLDATHVSTVVKGTPGYLDPEYFHNFQLTDKTDVYSFGVVLLELITSKKPIDLSKDAGEQNLAMCSTPLIRSGRVLEIIDSHMSSTLSREELQAVEAVAQVAVACLVSSRASRPSMSEVVEMLQRIKGSKLKAEEFYTKADVIDSKHSIIEMQGDGILSGDSGSTTRGTSSSGSGTVVTEPMRPR